MKTLVIAKKIYAMSSNHQTYSRMLIEDGRIMCFDQETVNYPADNVIDLSNKTLLPSFNDTHMHLLGYALSLNQCLLEGCQSIDMLKELVGMFYQTNRPQWVIGRGWNHDVFQERRLPTRYDLDALNIPAPIVLYRACGHIAVVNSIALKVLGLTPDTHIRGGALDVQNGALTGILRENALSFIGTHTPPIEKEQWQRYIEAAINALHRYGITSVQTDDLVFMDIPSLESIFQHPPLKSLKVYEQCQIIGSDTLQTAIHNGYHMNKGDRHFKLGPLKILADGSLGARTAKLSKPYHDAPGETGILIYPVDELNRLVRIAHQHHIDTAIHGIGDETIELAINAIKHTAHLHPDHRSSIVHCQIMSWDQMDAMAQHRISALVQPVFLEYDMTIVKDRIGDALSKSSYAYKTMLNKGIRLGFGSDAPVEDPNPFRSLYYAVTRKRPDGQSFYTEESISLYDAWRAFTHEAAYFSYESHEKGLLEKQYYADFIALDVDPFEIPAEDLLTLEVTHTFVDGKLVYQR